MKKYGNILIENVPNESTQFLKALCTNYKPSNKPLVDQVCIYMSYILLFVLISYDKYLTSYVRKKKFINSFIFAGSFEWLYRTAC